MEKVLYKSQVLSMLQTYYGKNIVLIDDKELRDWFENSNYKKLIIKDKMGDEETIVDKDHFADFMREQINIYRLVTGE